MGKILDELKDFDNASLDVCPKNSAAIIIYLKVGFTIRKWNANRFGRGKHRLFLVKTLEIFK